MCKNEVIFFVQADLQRFAMRNIYRSLPLFLIDATQKELAWQAQYLAFKNHFFRSRVSRRVIPRSPTEAADAGFAEHDAAIDLPARRARLGGHTHRAGGVRTGAGRATPPSSRQRDMLPLAAAG
jgi:hypothetical protein